MAQANVIDSLVISLSLDPTNFNAQQRLAVQNLRRFEGQAKTSATNVETSATKMVDGFSRVTKEILGLGAAILGVSGLKDLLVHTVQTSAALGRQASVLDINTEALNRWINAARLAGVASGTAQSAISSVVTRLGALRTGQATPSELGARALRTLGLDISWDWETFLMKAAEGFQHKQDPGVRRSLAQEIPGIDDLLLLLQKGPEGVTKLLAESQTATKEQTEASIRLATEMTRLILALEKLTAALIPKIEGPVVGTIRGVRDILHGDTSKGILGIGGAILPGTEFGGRKVFDFRESAYPEPIGPEQPNAFSGARSFFGSRSGRNVGYGADFGRFSAAREGQAGGWVPDYLNIPTRLGTASAAGFTRGGDTANDNSRTVHVHNLNITAPPGADPFQFAKQFSAAVQAQGGGR